jgi:hypothetical protein
MLKVYGWTKCFLMACFNVSFLVIGILMYNSDGEIYENVIKYETQEWSKYAIIDITYSNNSSCPDDYNMVTAKFYGLKQICRRGDIYKLGPCRSEDKGY